MGSAQLCRARLLRTEHTEEGMRISCQRAATLSHRCRLEYRELPSDLGEYLEILAKAWPVGAWGAAGTHAVVELEQLALESFLIGGREPCHLQLLPVHALDVDERRRIPQVRRGEADQHPSVGGVETERLPIVFDIRKHRPGVDGAHVVLVGEGRREARPACPEVGGEDVFRLSDRAAQGVDVVDRADEEQEVGGEHSGIVAPSRFTQEVERLAGQDVLLDAIEHRRTIPLLLGLARFTTADDRMVRVVERTLRLQRRSLDVTEITQSLHQLNPALITGVVLLHHPDHQRLTGALGRCDDVISLAQGVRQWLLHQHMQPSLERGDGHRPVVTAGENQDDIERLGQELVGGGKQAVHAVLPADLRQHNRIDVTECGDLEAVVQLAKVGQMHDLSDRAHANDPRPQPFHREALLSTYKRSHGGQHATPARPARTDSYSAVTRIQLTTTGKWSPQATTTAPSN